MSVYECPECGNDVVTEHLYSCYVKRELTITQEGDYEIENERVYSAEGSEIEYSCGNCDYKFKATNIEDLILEMETTELESCHRSVEGFVDYLRTL